MASSLPGSKHSVDPEILHSFKEKPQHYKKSWRAGIMQHFKDYCNSTTIHGFVYFGDGRTWIEIFCWAIIFILAICGSIYMISEIYMKWLECPVIISFATKKASLYKIPIPSITVCPVNRIDPKIFNLTAYNEMKDDIPLQNVTYFNQLAEYMAMVCDEYDKEDSTKEFFDPGEFFNIMSKNRPVIEAYVLYNGQCENGQCEMKKIVTEKGLCYTFNQIRHDEMFTDIVENIPETYLNETHFPESNWDMQTGRHKVSNILESYPRRALKAGINNAIYLVVEEQSEGYDFLCQGFFSGYTVTIDYPETMPQTSESYFLLPYNDVILVPMRAALISTSETVKRYKPSQRDCYFHNEKPLKYFKTYTRSNCELECVTDAILKECGCVRFYMPREKGTKICGPLKEECVISVSEKLKADIQQKVDEEYGVKDNNVENGKQKCDCLALCTAVTYKSETEPFRIKPEQMKTFKDAVWESRSLELEEDVPSNDSFSVAVLYFKEDKISTTERNELYGPTDFISNFGGLLGLFTGFSILSFMEIIYFLTLRIFGNIQLFGYWAGPRN